MPFPDTKTATRRPRLVRKRVFILLIPLAAKGKVSGVDELIRKLAIRVRKQQLELSARLMCQLIVTIDKEIRIGRAIQLRNLVIGPFSTLMVTNTFVQNIENRRDNSMKNKLQLFAVSILALFAVACTQNLVKMYNVHDQPIPPGLTQDQVRKAIKIGAGVAGWSTVELSPSSIAATYHIRRHTVTALIRYTEQAYSIDYKTSYQMKVYCTEEDKVEKRAKQLTTGGGTCPGVDQPAYIHKNYNVWIEVLERGIRSALQNIG